ncbi:class I SAM-dependent methyltransferase [Methylocystis sp. H62]|uniref:class I SAM-dependent methyltransferase n=1 Tax=Methylocystis sp. H62 TaxID=2785789 RepID=UPI0018C2FBFE|nr:class I SAM-dependent methyltransferase [Methylocystis sp. H62]MBG0792632.1 class I SAM-dependent methyltransferase [Methylocystis sp. H62]
MKSFLKRIEAKLWTIRLGEPPCYTSFRATVTDKLRRNYTGKAASIFFENRGRIIHKWLHYLPIYDSLLGCYRQADVRVLEIGVSKGGSLDMWRKFLGDRATIFGVDNNPECAPLDTQTGPVRIGSQDDVDFLLSVVKEMGGLDIVLDDGSHIACHQRASFETLWPLISEGGLYIVEDTHTAYWPQFEGGLRRRGTIIEYFKNKVDHMHKHYQAGGSNTPEAMTDIESVQFFDSIIAIRKRKQFPRYTVMTGETDGEKQTNAVMLETPRCS